jgi:hypothetical protein
MNGINIQYPWSDFLINAEKCVETRSYPLPSKYIGEELALIETPGEKNNFKSRIIGTITFSHSFLYPNFKTWKNDYNRHLVSLESKFAWNDKPKYGWVVSNIQKFEEFQEPPKNKGIIFTKNCNINYPLKLCV